MSRSTLWLLPSVLLVLGGIAIAAPGVDAPLPAAVTALLPRLEAKGRAEMTFMTLPVYTAYFYCVDLARCKGSPEQPFALQLVYHRSLDGGRIADRSSDEIAKLGYGTAEQQARWGARMKHLFIDVNDGDVITGVNLPKVGVRYYYNGKLLGDIADVEFAKAFFGIWLDPRTSEPDIRKDLLGERG